jgi:hypothetical protein
VDEVTLRERAQAHGDAVVAQDFATAGSDLTKESAATAGAVMQALPRGLTSAAIDTIEAEGDGFVVGIRYSNDSESKTVASTWADVDGDAKIVKLEVR